MSPNQDHAPRLRSRTLRNQVLAVGGLVFAVVAFLLFRPDTLFTNVRIDESLEDAFASEADDIADAQPTTSLQEVTTTASPPAEIAEVGSGRLSGIDHRATGTATIYEQDGRFVLRFEGDTDIQNGPDLYVWVLPSDEYEGGVPDVYIDLGRLTGNVGSQNYPLPEAFDPTLHRTVLVWCLRFAVPFAAASLR